MKLQRRLNRVNNWSEAWLVLLTAIILVIVILVIVQGMLRDVDWYSLI